MTFAKAVKNELITVPVKENEMLAEFSAFLNLSCEFHIENNVKMLDFQTKNPTVTKRFLLLTRSLYQSETSLLKKDQQKFSKKPLIIFRLSTNVEKIITEHGYLDDPIETMKLIVKSPEEKKAFIRAAFLVSGSINDPKKAEYHLEIFGNKADEIVYLQSLMNFFDLNARISKRRNGFIVYLKDAESISYFMQLVGANNAVFKYEDIRIKRDFNNSINRIMNCEIANEKKAYVAAVDQLKDIAVIESFYLGSQIDFKTYQAIALRKKYPEANLRELVEYFFDEYQEKISKSGLSHRYTKIKKIAETLREENNL